MSTFSTLYDNGEYGYMGIGPMPAKSITLTLTAPSSNAFYCGGGTYWGVCAYNPSDKTKYAVLKSNPLHEVYQSGYSYVLVGDDDRPGVPKSVTVEIPISSNKWNFYGGLTSVVGCALCLITYTGTGEHIMYTSGNSPCNSDYASISNAQKSWFTYEYVATRYANEIDSCPILAERSANDANGDRIDTTYLKIANMPAIPTAGRNLNLNQYGAMQTSLPGGTFDAPANQSNDFERLTNADFAGAFRLACRHNVYDSYELAIAYTASGMSSSYSFIGTETIVALDNTVTTKQAVYLAETCLYTPTTKFGGVASTAFDPTRHKAIIYDGIAQIGPTSDCKIAIYSDANSNVKIAFTAIEVAKVGSTT